MRKIIACEFMTLDGVIQNEDEGDGFRWGGWFFPFADEVTGAVMQERLGKPVDLLLGRADLCRKGNVLADAFAPSGRTV